MPACTARKHELHPESKCDRHYAIFKCPYFHSRVCRFSFSSIFPTRDLLIYRTTCTDPPEILSDTQQMSMRHLEEASEPTHWGSGSHLRPVLPLCFWNKWIHLRTMQYRTDRALPNIPKSSSFRVPTPYSSQGSAFSSFLDAHLNGLGTCTDSSLTASSRTHDTSDGELVPTHPSRLSSLFPASNVNCL